jgi:UDP-N-acetylmuramyl pentapeptide synthase
MPQDSMARQFNLSCAPPKFLALPILRPNYTACTNIGPSYITALHERSAVRQALQHKSHLLQTKLINETYMTRLAQL